MQLLFGMTPQNLWRSTSSGRSKTKLIETTMLSAAEANQPPNPALQPTANPLRGLSAAELGRYAMDTMRAY